MAIRSMRACIRMRCRCCRMRSSSCCCISSQERKRRTARRLDALGYPVKTARVMPIRAVFLCAPDDRPRRQLRRAGVDRHMLERQLAQVLEERLRRNGPRRRIADLAVDAQAGGIEFARKILAQIAAAWMVDAALRDCRIERTHGDFPAPAGVVQASQQL